LKLFCAGAQFKFESIHDFDLNESLLSELCVKLLGRIESMHSRDDYVTTAPKRKSVNDDNNLNCRTRQHVAWG